MSNNSENSSVAPSPGTGGSDDMVKVFRQGKNGKKELFRKNKNLKIISKNNTEKLNEPYNSPGTGDSPHLGNRKRSSITELDLLQHQAN